MAKGFSVGDLKRLLLVHSKQTVALSRKSGKRGGRHVVWRAASLYRCIRPGTRTFANEREIDELYAAKALDEAHFWLFQHCDPQAKRSEITPLYEAVYKCGDDGCLVLTQKCHLMQAYVRAARTKSEAMWDVLPSGEPYWVDRYAFRKAKQRSAKMRYESGRK